MMEISVISSKSVRFRIDWRSIFAEKIKEFEFGRNGNSKDTININFGKDEKTAGCLNAWREYCKYVLKKKSKTHIIRHQLGTTIQLGIRNA